jgi:hypothetical protein
MAKNRMINTRFWCDSYISAVDPLEKLLFLYLITNQYTNICGIYEIPLKQIALDTGIDRDNLEKVFLPRLKKAQKVYYFDGWIYVKNFLKHQKASGNVRLGIEAGLNEVPPEILTKIKEISNTPTSDPQHTPDTAYNLNINLNSNINIKAKEQTVPKGTTLQELIEPLKSRYNPKMIEDFLNYWTEKNPNGKKEKWQMQKIFDPARRLATWAGKEWNKPKKDFSNLTM